eukprot:GILI01005832.1.p2 GENE.GILI01005832.1~~GILI01005832.1.p2  ORF type:complete len:234 (-),score=86.49 GILI01005832.1:103-804(-)
MRKQALLILLIVGSFVANVSALRGPDASGPSDDAGGESGGTGMDLGCASGAVTKCGGTKKGNVKVIEDVSDVTNSASGFAVLNSETFSWYGSEDVAQLKGSIHIDHIDFPISMIASAPKCFLIASKAEKKSVGICASNADEKASWLNSLIVLKKCQTSGKAPACPCELFNSMVTVTAGEKCACGGGAGAGPEGGDKEGEKGGDGEKGAEGGDEKGEGDKPAFLEVLVKNTRRL